MEISTTIHVLPVADGGWAVQADDPRASSVHSSRGLAVARARELVES